ncbi:Peroxisomal catalase [Fusarium oxysporum f. sp. albedinis]|nr:Peroxisomal catalase [Fusarium oxysporum f. sp. albedinis]
MLLFFMIYLNVAYFPSLRKDVSSLSAPAKPPLIVTSIAYRDGTSGLPEPCRGPAEDATQILLVYSH